MLASSLEPGQAQTPTMFFRPTSRLFAIKFLGLFGSASSQQQWQQHDSGGKPQEPPVDLAISNVEGVESKEHRNETRTSNAIKLGSNKLVGLMLERGIPGLTICVSKRGRVVWHGAFGFCDVENGLECKPEARMRIASISKSVFAATLIGKLVEQNQLDLNSSVHEYLTNEEFTKQKFQGKEVDITVKQLLSHTSGIRHYIGEDGDQPLKPIGSEGSLKVYQCEDQYNRLEKFQRKTFRTVIDALEPIRENSVTNEPGKFQYTSYGFTLLSAVGEKVLHRRSKANGCKKEQIEDYWMKLLRRDWDMTETSLDQDEPIISNRARYYLRSGLGGRLINAPYTDNSVKWAGGGLTSSAKDLVKFGSALIDSYKERDSAKLKKSTIELLWTEVKDSYCLGFMTKSIKLKDNERQEKVIFHTGSAIGASSVLVIQPEAEIVVAILTNMHNINLFPVGLEIANEFAKNKE